MKLFSAILTSYLALASGLSTPNTSKTAPVDVNGNLQTVFPMPTEIEKPKLMSLSTKAAVGMGMALAFNAGAVNAVSLSGLIDGTKMGTAAVTGAWTNSAIGAASAVQGGAASQFLFNAKCIVSYICGAIISGFVIPDPKAFEVDVKKTVPLFAIGSALLATSGVLAGAANAKYFYFALLACGLQNSFTSTLTANLCRTSHFTGISSDMGTFIGQVLRGNKAQAGRLKNIALIAASFWTGGFLSFGWTKTFGHKVLFGASAIHLAFAAWVGLKSRSAESKTA
mmetsp:Transcript_25846/g.60610  ORF Transcript_25846/g.60610 Transcript_25846/m.60610 type:complete len:282 (+) Transcript_25846:199-1044(+)